MFPALAQPLVKLLPGRRVGDRAVIEDALKGLHAAKAAKMRCVIIQNQMNLSIDFSQADLVISSLSEFATSLET